MYVRQQLVGEGTVPTLAVWAEPGEADNQDWPSPR